MATKSKLEQAVERQASKLNDAQRELLLSQFSVYKRNNARISEIEDALGFKGVRFGDGRETAAFLAQRAALATERSQLVSANNEIASRLFTQLKDE